jgi:hypothetical protein
MNILAYRATPSEYEATRVRKRAIAESRLWYCREVPIKRWVYTCGKKRYLDEISIWSKSVTTVKLPQSLYISLCKHMEYLLPASIRSTLTLGFSVKRFAITAPAVPPKITVSNQSDD